MGKKLSWIMLSMLASAVALANDGDEAAVAAVVGGSSYYAIAAAFGIAIAVVGAALGQGKIGAAAMEGIARNPQASKDMFVPMILGLVFVETLFIFAFAICFLIQGKA